MSKFNIATKAVSATAPIHLKDADGELMFADDARTLPVRILVHGPGSKAYGVVEARQSNRAVKRMQDNDGKVTVAPYEQRIVETAEDLASITAAFEKFEYPPAGGAVGEDLFRAVYAEPTLGFIAKQVTRFVGDWGNFKPGSAAN